MNHYIKTILLISTLVLLLSVNLCEANELEYEIGEIHYRIENNKAVITNYTGNDKILFIPKQLNGYEVAKIDSFAFAFCVNLTSVIVPASVTKIDGTGYASFRGCHNLTLTIQRDSYAVQFCKSKNQRYTYSDSLDWLNQ